MGMKGERSGKGDLWEAGKIQFLCSEICEMRWENLRLRVQITASGKPHIPASSRWEETDGSDRVRIYPKRPT